jgi:hypothetical protein
MIMHRSARLAPLALVLFAACAGDTPGGGSGGRPVDCNASDSTKAVTALAVGEMKVLSGNATNCVRLAGSGGTSSYLAIVNNVGETADVTRTFKLAVDLDAQPAAAVSADLASAGAGANAALAGALTAGPRMHDAHERLLAAARRFDLGGVRSARTATSSSPALASGIRGAIFPTGATPSIGQVATVRVPSVAAGDEPCDDFTTVTTTVKFVSQRAIIIQDNASPANGFSDADFQAIGNEFDNLIYATDTTYFGTGSDEDGNGRIIILYTPEVNKATPRNSTSLLAGFFWAGDLFPRTGSGNQACTQSNVGELFYLLVPDPTGTFSSARQVADVREKTRGTVAHEFQHMLNAGSRLNNNAVSSFEAVWLDEALAHMAEELVGRAKLGAGPLQELTHAQVFDAGNGLKDYNAFFYQNFARFDDWLRDPGAKAPISAQADSSLAVRGAAWALVRYAADNYSGDNPKTFLRGLAAGPGIGIANLKSKLVGGVTLETVLTGWQVANFADNMGIPNLPQRLTYRSWNMREAVSGAINGAYPLKVTRIPTGNTISDDVRSTGGASYYFADVAGGLFLALQLTNGAGTTAGFQDGRLTLLRVQ